MAEVKILIEGYANEEAASSSTVLIIFNNKKIVVDPGTNYPRLIKSLRAKNLSVDEIDFVILTHMHFDHSALVGIFKNAVIFDNNSSHTLDGKYYDGHKNIADLDIEIIDTPGHDKAHCSVLAKDKIRGRIAIAGDVFWKWDDENAKEDAKGLLARKDPYEKDQNALLKSRKILIEKADYIIPGHGKMFKVKK